MKIYLRGNKTDCARTCLPRLIVSKFSMLIKRLWFKFENIYSM